MGYFSNLDLELTEFAGDYHRQTPTHCGKKVNIIQFIEPQIICICRVCNAEVTATLRSKNDRSDNKR